MRFQPHPKPPESRPGYATAASVQPAVTVHASAYVQSLDYWLDSDAARMAPVESTSALRDLAWSYGQWLGFRAAVGGLGITLIGGSALTLLTAPGPVAVWLLLLCGLALVVTGWLVARAKLPGVVHGRGPAISRAAGTTGSGLGLALFMTAVSWVLLFVVFQSRSAQGPAEALTLAAYCLLFLLGCLSVFAGPGYCAQHGRRFFRRRIERDPKVRQALESLALTWRDPVADRNFGPL